MGEVLISVKGVGKKFCRNLKKSLWYGLCDAAMSVVHGREHRSEVLRKDEFWAVEDVSFEVKRGECIGLIGKNGAGKTTILKMLNGLILPDRGQIEMRGRVGGLIALGAGFNPLLTGRENVFVNGAILGMNRRTIEERLDEIAAFADIGAFMDAPVQSYSSGMSVRLGFAVVAILLKPDILLLDEVLAVGDMGFIIKCLNKVRDLAADSAVVFVSHDMRLVSLFCTSVGLLTKSRMQLLTDSVGEGLNAYYNLFPQELHTSGLGGVELREVQLNSASLFLTDGVPTLPQGEEAALTFRLYSASSQSCLKLGIAIVDQTMNEVICYHPVKVTCGDIHARVPLGSIELNAGKYAFIIAICDESDRILSRQQGVCAFNVKADKTYWAKIIRATSCEITTV